MRKFHPPEVPFVEAYHKGGKQRPTAIVLRSSFTTSEKGAALGIANYLHQRNSPLESYHYVLDEAMTYQGVDNHTVAFHNSSELKGALCINICSEPVTDAGLWDDCEHVKALDRTVDLVAQLALAYNIPIRYLDAEGQRRWRKLRLRRRGGIIIRVAGEWPAEQFLANVKTQAAFFKSAL